ncbi:hypothetical protein [Streptomyces cucumeris]|uniref:hypothetical protein n=1 Tax=Streptomyces cucumeris TaxID=2962890 RepID=UPI003D726E47
MIRFVTSRRLRALSAQCEQAQARARDVQERADQAYSGYIRSLYGVTARAEEAEGDAAILREQVAELSAAGDDAAAELTAYAERVTVLAKELEAARLEGRSVWLLLHFGEPHSIYSTAKAAMDYTATLGARREGWVSGDDRPAHEVSWRLLALTKEEGRDAFVAP